MKQIKNTSNHSGFLDPEKVYFVEKFGYLLKKIDNGFGVPVQEALFQRIFMAVDKFKRDLPDVVHDLEMTRLKSIGRNKLTADVKKIDPINIVIPKQPKVQAGIIKGNAQEAQSDSTIIKKNTIETEIEVDLSEDMVKSKPIFPNIPDSKIVRTSSILRPTAATIREDNRQKQIQRMSQPKPIQKVAVKENISQPISRIKRRPKKELTVWERAWDKYDRFSEEAMNGHA